MPAGGGPSLPGGGSCLRRSRSASGNARSSPALAHSGPDGPGTRFRNDAWVVLSGIGRPRAARKAPRRPGSDAVEQGAPRSAGRREPRIMEDQWVAGKPGGWTALVDATPGGRGSGGAIGVGGEAFAAAALGGRAWIGEHELVVQALAHEVDGGAVDHRLAGGVDVDAHAVLLADAVAGARIARQFHLVAPARAAGLPDPETQPERIGIGGEELADAVECGGSELDGHGVILARGG